LLERTKNILSKAGKKLRRVIANAQCSDEKIRSAVASTVIPYPVNQKRSVRNLLRVDKKFRTYGPENQKKEHHKRPHIETANSFQKTQYSMASNRVRGVANVACYSLYSVLCMVLNREAAQNIGRKDKAISPTYFNT
jgi:hypothetical protein